MDFSALEKQGYIQLDFDRREHLSALQSLTESLFPCPPLLWHKQPDVSAEKHVEQVKKVLDKVLESKLVNKLIEDNTSVFTGILGPDFDLQVAPHLRVTRPEVEGDMVDWHRDSFYGSTPWELNVWFPIFPLHEGAGLRILPGSNAMPSKNVREATESDNFRKTVQKGSSAHQIGFVYAPKTDDTLAAMKTVDTVLLAPPAGSFILFFGCCIHRAQNRSEFTRISVDTRLKNSFAPTNTRPGYYQPVSSGVVSRVVRRFQEGC